MIKNYIKLAFRNLFRYRSNSIINILGLAIGIACFIYIFFILQHELKYDRYHNDIERLYRLNLKLQVEGRTTNYACLPSLYGRYIKDNIEEIEEFARFRPETESTCSYKDKKYIEEYLYYVEPDVFNIFSMEFINGNKTNALLRPYTAIITERYAHKYFGNENPVGELLKIDTSYFEITGVIKNHPKNTRMKLDILLAYSTGNPDQHSDWRAWGFFQTFIKLKKGIDPVKFEERLKSIPMLVAAEELERRKQTDIIQLQALKDIHTDTSIDYTWDTEPPVSGVYITILFITGIFILLIASLNYINISTAKYTTRAKEVSLRKTSGAMKKQLIGQFIGESLVLVFIAHVIGMFLVEFSIGQFNLLTDLQFNVDYSSVSLWVIIIGIIVFVGVLAGSYPAFLLASFNPVDLHTNKIIHAKGGSMKKVIVIIQYTLTLILVIGTISILKQVNYMKKMDLGFSKDQVFVVEFPRNLLNSDSYETVKREFKQVSGVENTTFSSSVPGKWRYKWRIWPTGESTTKSKHIFCMQIDNNFLDFYGIKLIKGENFSNNPNLNSGWILNEEAVKVYGWTNDSAMTKKLHDRGTPIRGIIKNYHIEGLQKPIEPLALYFHNDDYRYLSLKLSTQKLKITLDEIEQLYSTMYPELIYNYFFLDEDFEKQYESENRIANLFVIFTIIGLIIAIIGILALSAFICQRKEKEIGIRKANGATTRQIFSLLSKEFTILIIISFLISIPIAYFGSQRWLNNFAYRTNISWELIIATGIIAWAITMITISFQTIRASRKNPADILRFE